MESRQKEVSEKLMNQTVLFEKLEHLYTFVDAIPEIYCILDDERKVVYANHALKEFLKDSQNTEFSGRLPGDLLHCKHAAESVYGCGSTETCKTCGAFKAIQESLHGKNSIQECRIEQHESGDALDFRVWATPYIIDGNTYSILALTDISDEKRRQALEKIFFHDILNTAGGLYGIAQLLVECPDEVDEFKEIIYGLTEKLIDEINSQKMLMSAENHDLRPDPIQLNSINLMNDLIISYRKHYMVKNRDLQLDSAAAEVNFWTDRTMLRRVLLNMMKNAVEASPVNSTITVGCSQDGDFVEFWVHNSSFMPKEVQLQVFKRSFSTKGAGRGLGTYSMKLLSERYLQGKVSFTSTEDYGTVFTARYPIKWEDN